jgi:hypothetical protein
MRCRAALAYVLVLPFVCGVATEARPTTASLEGWRASDGGQGWMADSRRGVLVVDRHSPGSLIAAGDGCQKSVGVALRVLQSYDPWARLEIRVRSSGDERSYWAAVVEPERRRVLLECVHDGRRLDDKTKSASIARIETERTYRLGCRLEGTRVVVQFDGRDVLVADGLGPAVRGHVGLAAAGIRAELSELAVETGRPEFFDTFDTLGAWKPSYGPDAWRVEADATLRPKNHVAVFSASTDAAIVGGPEWSHFAAEVKGKFVDASNTWACFGLRPKLSKGSFYVFEVRGKQSRLSVWKQWQGRRDPAVAREVPLARIETGRWYTLRCELVGDSIRVDFDGRRVLELVDPRPIPAGRTAISASYGTVQFDDFRQEEIASNYTFAKEEKRPEPYVAGAALESASPSGAEDAAYWYLERPGLRVAVHRRTGMLGGLWLADGRRVVDRLDRLYHVQTRTSDTLGDEHADTVTELVRRSAGELLLRSTSRALPGVSIEKHYRLQADSLVRTLRLTNRGTEPDLFVTVSERAVLDESFRRGATYTGGSYFGPLVPAAEVRERVLTDAFKQPWKTGITNGRPSWILALHWALDRHLASYRYRVNGRYVLPWNSIWTEGLDLYHTPAGWEMGLATLHLEPGREQSVESHERAFRGGRLEF